MSLPIDSIQPPIPPVRPNHHLATTCELHPEETVTGFCVSCLRERLSGLESSNSTCAPGRKSTSALKSLFPKLPSSNSFLRPDLRRCKSFSYRRGGDKGDPFEPQRHSCDVRGRNTLWSLFHQDDRERVRDGTGIDAFPASSSAAVVALSGEILPERSGSLVFSRMSFTETQEEGREEIGEEEYCDADDGEEIRPVVEPVLIYGTSGEIEDSVNVPVPGDLQERLDNVMPMKDHIDQESQQKKLPAKDLKEIAGSFWLAASVFSKKWQKWRRKQKLKKQCSSKAAAAAMPLPPENLTKPSFLRLRRRRSRESEFISGEMLGRRSCDTDPRFSLDVGRMSVDDPTFSWDEPRASWDGYLIGGGRSVLSRPLPMLSVLENAPIPPVPRSDGLIPVEEDCASGTAPGGLNQTHDYYVNSSDRQRRSFERSSSVRRPSFSLENNDSKPMAVDAKVSSPAGGSEFYHFLDRDFVCTNSFKDDMSFSFESAFRDPRKANPAKKARRWGKAWGILAFIHRRGNNREGNGLADRSLSECNGAKIMRSNSRGSMSSRSSFSGNGSSRKHVMERNGLERNRSARYSPGRIDNGMLRFYLTPMRNSRRNGIAGKGRHVNSHLFTRSIIGLS
ncbi:hypothetical protein FCM35_KLT20710 [Carex littledalei]|uniref:Uncharacterized protein n=1 Tax=Carex littledalei TaxID=544730 RepID=A0A833VCM5_9POAL|nr:hypothetical protein FCM35_KLT20710 [Carex littledalei]